MFRPLAFFIGLRYTRAKRRNHFISFISLVSMLGLILGVTVLIVVISVMNGFDHELRSRILGAVAHATVSGSSAEGVQDWPRAVHIAESDPHVLGAAPYVDGYALLQGRQPAGAIIRGVLPDLEKNVSDIDRHMKAGALGELTPGSWNIVLGSELAMKLGVGVGDKVTLYAPEFRVTPMGAVPRLRSFNVAGIFELGMQEYDAGLALIPMGDAEKLYGMAGPTGIRLRLDDIFQAWPVARELAVELGPLYRVQTWMQSNANLFRAIDMEKLVMGLILSLIIAVAAFNLVSSLVMLVTDKQADIAILRTLGMTPRTVMGVFMVQGMVIGTIGIGLGVLFGTLLAINLPSIVEWIEHVFHVQFLSPDIYYISELPSELHWRDVGWITGLALVFSLLATLYPAWRAARTQPAQALRYE
jgi:lipoprotein-releasing system permease protein